MRAFLSPSRSHPTRTCHRPSKTKHKHRHTATQYSTMYSQCFLSIIILQTATQSIRKHSVHQSPGQEQATGFRNEASGSNKALAPLHFKARCTAFVPEAKGAVREQEQPGSASPLLLPQPVEPAQKKKKKKPNKNKHLMKTVTHQELRHRVQGYRTVQFAVFILCTEV